MTNQSCARTCLTHYRLWARRTPARLSTSRGLFKNLRKAPVALVPAALPGSWTAVPVHLRAGGKQHGFGGGQQSAVQVCGDNISLQGVISGHCWQQDAKAVVIKPNDEYRFKAEITIPKGAQGTYSANFLYWYGTPTAEDKKNAVFDCELQSNDVQFEVVANEEK